MAYQKGEPQLEMGQPRHADKSVPVAEAKPPLPLSPVGYTKGDGMLSPMAFLVIFSGGERREEDYFKVIVQQPDKFPNLKLRFFVEDKYKAGHEPLVYRLALDKVDEYNASSSPDAPDDFFVVTDVDLFWQHILAYKPVFEGKGISLIVNNPCLEVWLYYSKLADKFEGFVAPANPEALSSAVKTFVHAKTGGVNPQKAIFDIEANIRNAQANYAIDEHGLPVRFSTNMFILAERMLPLVKPGLEAIAAEREAIKKAWLEKGRNVI